MKNIIISVPNGLLALSFLRSGILEYLLNEEIFIHIISPLSFDQRFINQFNGIKNVNIIKPYPKHRPSFIENILKNIATENQVNLFKNESIRTKQIRRKEQIQTKSVEKKLYFYLIKLLSNIFSYKLYFLIEKYLFSNKVYNNIVRKIKPDLILVGAPGTSFNKELRLIRAGRENNIPVIAMGMSWDHFSAKYTLVRSVDKLIVWNTTMKNEAKEWTQMNSDDIYVGGVPHFDYYLNKDNYQSKKDFFQKMKLDINKKLILVVVETKSIFLYFDQIIDQLLYAIKKGEIEPSQILVRLHPYNDFDYQERYKDNPDIIVDWNFHRTNVSNIHLQMDFYPKDQIHLINTLYHSDLVVATTSTVSLEASICNTPVININYDGDQSLPYHKSITRFYKFSHYNRIIKMGAVELVNNKDELIKSCNKYILNPDLGSQNRKRVVKKLIFETDDFASERYAKYIINFLDILDS